VFVIARKENRKNLLEENRQKFERENQLYFRTVLNSITIVVSLHKATIYFAD